MILTVLIFLLPLTVIFSGLRHWLFSIHVMLLAAVSWSIFPSLTYDIFHPYYLIFLGGWHLAFINLISFFAYGWDKRQAKMGGWRVPEKTLHQLAFIGGTFGAWIGSKLFRHKTIKGSFKQMFIAVIIAQLITIGISFWISSM